jgi:hypothetical protein
MGDQPVTRPILAHRKKHTEQKHTELNVSSEIQTHDTTICVSEYN